jgi:hypothetical protein
MFRMTDGYFGWCVTAMLAVGVAVAQPAPSDTDESAYAPATLARVMGGAARAQNDEAELGAAGQWFTTTATFTGRKRPISGRYRPIIGAWLSSRGEGQDVVEMYFAGELKEVEFEQGGKKHWVLAGLPGGLGFDVYPPGQKLSIYLQRIGFASGTPVAAGRRDFRDRAQRAPHAQCARGRGRAAPGGCLSQWHGDVHVRRP